MSQFELFPESTEPVSTVPDVEDVRNRLNAILDLLRNASEMPWNEREVARWSIVVPQMTDWLPEDEAHQLKFDFEREIERLKAA